MAQNHDPLALDQNVTDLAPLDRAVKEHKSRVHVTDRAAWATIGSVLGQLIGFAAHIQLSETKILLTLGCAALLGALSALGVLPGRNVHRLGSLFLQVTVFRLLFTCDLIDLKRYRELVARATEDHWSEPK